MGTRNRASVGYAPSDPIEVPTRWTSDNLPTQITNGLIREKNAASSRKYRATGTTRVAVKILCAVILIPDLDNLRETNGRSRVSHLLNEVFGRWIGFRQSTLAREAQSTSANAPPLTLSPDLL